MMAVPILETVTRDILTPLRVCNEILGYCNNPTVETLTVADYQTRVLADKPAENQNNDFVNKLYEQVYAAENERPKLTFLHISDVHIDAEYVDGTLWDCDDYVCCRVQSGIPTDPAKAAGHWGGYKCDLPMRTFQNMLEHIVETHGSEIDGIFWTGDNSPHNTYDNTVEEVVYYTRQITKEIKSAFLNSGIPVYPSTGNHDTWPVNVEDFSAPGINYPINHIVEDWHEWLGDEAAAEFVQYGYCSLPFVPAGEGSRVLVLNTQAAND